MAGYKQANADNKANFRKHTYSDEHRQMVELIYRLPITGGYAQDLYYSVIKEHSSKLCRYHMEKDELKQEIIEMVNNCQSLYWLKAIYAYLNKLIG